MTEKQNTSEARHAANTPNAAKIGAKYTLIYINQNKKNMGSNDITYRI